MLKPSNKISWQNSNLFQQLKITMLVKINRKLKTKNKSVSKQNKTNKMSLFKYNFWMEVSQKIIKPVRINQIRTY